MQRESPNLIRSSHGDVQEAFIGRQDESIWRYAIGDKHVQSTIWAESIYATSLIDHGGLTLIREVDLAFRADDNIVETFESFQVPSGEEWLYRVLVRIKQ